MTNHTESAEIPDDVSHMLDALEEFATIAPATDSPPSAPGVADQFETLILWLSPKPMVPGRQYGISLGGVGALCTPERPKYRLERGSPRRLAARALRSNEVGVTNISLDTPLAFQPCAASRDLGRFLLTDRATGALAGAGLIHFALRRSANLQRQLLTVNPAARAALNSHEACVLWFTGLSGAGKSTIANLVEYTLNSKGCHTILLDGDNVRHGLNRDLGFTEADRAENIRRIAEVAKLMTDAGLITLVSFISPFTSERRTARELIGSDKFVEIFVDTPLEVAEARDTKGLYKKARRGEILNFTGIDSPYEQPESPDLQLPASAATPDECAARVIALLHHRKVIP